MEWEKEANAVESEAAAAVKTEKPDTAPESSDPQPTAGDEQRMNWVEKTWDDIIPADIIKQTEDQHNEERLKELYLPARKHRVSLPESELKKPKAGFVMSCVWRAKIVESLSLSFSLASTPSEDF